MKEHVHQCKLPSVPLQTYKSHVAVNALQEITMIFSYPGLNCGPKNQRM